MQGIGVLLKNGGRRPPMATFSHNKGRRKENDRPGMTIQQKSPILRPGF
jgi:hypothetical protein